MWNQVRKSVFFLIFWWLITYILEQELEKIVEVFLGQFRQLFGLKSNPQHVGLSSTFDILTSEKGFTEWLGKYLYIPLFKFQYILYRAPTVKIYLTNCMMLVWTFEPCNVYNTFYVKLMYLYRWSMCREIDFLSRQHSCFNLHSCASSLGSLSRLVCTELFVEFEVRSFNLVRECLDSLFG